jgi:hypothetical protein
MTWSSPATSQPTTKPTAAADKLAAAGACPEPAPTARWCAALSVVASLLPAKPLLPLPPLPLPPLPLPSLLLPGLPHGATATKQHAMSRVSSA